MIGVVVFLYAAVALSSVIMLVSWGGIAAQFNNADHGPLRWCKRFLISAGLAVHSGGMIIGAGYRAIDTWIRPQDTGIADALGVTAFMGMILFSKMILIWVVFTDETARKVSWLWYAYLASIVLLGLAIGTAAVVTL